MNALICSKCGASKWKEEEDYLICLYCETKYLKTQEHRVTKSSSIALNKDVERLLQKCKTDKINARKYANLVLDIDPTNKEAIKYLG